MTVRFNHPRAVLLAVAAAGLLAAVGLVVVLYAQPAEANYPGTNGKIAYSGGGGNNLEIYTIDPNGGNNVKVTNNQLANERPAYSPTDNKIAFQGRDPNGGDWEIYTANLDGGSRFNVTDNNVDDENPYYSPSGNRIAYSSKVTNDWDIYTIDTNGGSRQSVTNTSSDERNPAFAPSGTKNFREIAYSRRDGNDWDIYTIDTTGAAPKNITNTDSSDDEDPDYSPDGKWIAYSSFPPTGATGDADIYQINSSGFGNKSNITSDNTADDFWPSYSPDGTKIAYVSGPANGDTEIYYINTNGGGRTPVTNNKTQNLNPYWGCEGGCK
jgi:Tol biopolymer transport system component